MQSELPIRIGSQSDLYLSGNETIVSGGSSLIELISGAINFSLTGATNNVELTSGSFNLLSVDYYLEGETLLCRSTESWDSADDVRGATMKSIAQYVATVALEGAEGEANTASNVGSLGVGLVKGKTVADLEFYRIYSTNSRLTVSIYNSDYFKLDLSDPTIETIAGSKTDKENYFVRLDSSGNCGYYDFSILDFLPTITPEVVKILSHNTSSQLVWIDVPSGTVTINDGILKWDSSAYNPYTTRSPGLLYVVVPESNEPTGANDHLGYDGTFYATNLKMGTEQVATQTWVNNLLSGASLIDTNYYLSAISGTPNGNVNFIVTGVATPVSFNFAHNHDDLYVHLTQDTFKLGGYLRMANGLLLQLGSNGLNYIYGSDNLDEGLGSLYLAYKTNLIGYHVDTGNIFAGITDETGSYFQAYYNGAAVFKTAALGLNLVSGKYLLNGASLIENATEAGVTPADWQANDTITASQAAIAAYIATNGTGSVDLGNYYTKTEINAFFSGDPDVNGYNNDDWNTAFVWGDHHGMGYLDGASGSGNGNLVFTRTGAGLANITVSLAHNHDDLYSELSHDHDDDYAPIVHDHSRTIVLKIGDHNTPVIIGSGYAYITIPEQLDGWYVSEVGASVRTASTSGSVTVNLINSMSEQVFTGWMGILSPIITIGQGIYNSSYSGTQPIAAYNRRVYTGYVLRIDVNTAGTGAKGLEVRIKFTETDGD
jgi:hypothetical protein